MRIDGIHITNFLSFDDFDWSRLNPHLNVVIGPNGSGKTSLFHALRAVADCLNQQSTAPTLVWATATHRGSGGRRTITIVVDLEFTGEWEWRLIRAFFAAALCDERTIQQYIQGLPNGGNLDPQALAGYAAHVAIHFAPEAFSWFYTGRLVVTFDGLRWEVRYHARPGAAAPFELSIEGSHGISNFRGARQEQPWKGGSIFQVWFDSPPEANGTSEEEVVTEQTERPSRRDVIHSFLTKPPIEYDSVMLPEDAFPPLETLPELISNQYGTLLQVERPRSASLATHRLLEEASGATLLDNRMYGARWLFDLIFRHSLVFTDNLRLLPRHDFSPSELRTEDVDLSSGEYLALLLFHLKNSVLEERSARYAKVQALFQTLTGRAVDVGILPATGISTLQPVHATATHPDEPRLMLDITTRTQWGATPLEYSGAGVVESLLLSTLIEGDAHRVILLDEPASNLHPLVQTSLLAEIQRRQDNQFFITTHSPSLIPPEALTQVSRLHALSGHTIRTALDLGHLDAVQADKVRKELRRSTDLRALLFSRAVILTEGETELGALPVWFEQLGFSLARHDIAIHSVDGDTRFPIPVLLLHEFVVPWALVCDGKVIGDSTPPRILKYLASAGISDLPDVDGQDFSQTCEALARIGVFTLASNQREEFEALPVIRDHVEEAGRAVGASKARRGRYIAENYTCPEEVAELLEHLRAHLGS